MRPLIIAFTVLAVAAYSNMAHIGFLDNDEFVRKPIGRTTAVDKRGMEKEENSLESFNSFIEEKLMHQNQALEHLITAVDNSGDMIKKLIDNLSKGLEKPKLPTKAVVSENILRTSIPHNNSTAKKDHPLVRLGKNIPRYGKLAKDLILKDVYSGTDPTPLVEEDTSLPIIQSGSRRSFGGDPLLSPNQQSDDNQVNPWCPMALLCQKTVEPVCGFDDEFGYGRFEDFCHLLRVNCYWKYNFAVVYSCRPKL